MAAKPDKMAEFVNDQARCIAELKEALRPFGDAYRFMQAVPGSMRGQYEASMRCTGKVTVADLHRAAELTK